MANLDYKAKNKTTGQWLLGTPTYCREYIFAEDFNIDSVDNFEIEPETISQFTGLKDKNGTKIYHNDFLHFKKKNKYIDWDEIVLVIWCDEYAGFAYQLMSNKKRIFPFTYHDEIQEDFLNYCDVIGNKFDNSEYLN
jgi:uncharacterized phage protein (TIGR01671 family)